MDQFISNIVDESLLRLDPDEILKLDEQDSLVVNFTLTSSKTIVELPTKSYVDRLHAIHRNRRDLSSLFNERDNEFDNIKLTNLDSVSVNRDPCSDNELSKEKYVDDSKGEGTIVDFFKHLKTIWKYQSRNRL